MNDIEYKYENFHINEWIDFILRKLYGNIKKNKCVKNKII